MKKLLSVLVFVAAGVLVSSCSKSFDDSSLQTQAKELESRIITLEGLAASLNSNIASLEQLVATLQAHKLIASVEETGSGFRLTFTDNHFIDIRQGSNGSDGTIGVNGRDGISPIIGIDQFNGVYCWTITIGSDTDFLLDPKGNKIPVTAVGKDGGNGMDGKNGNTPVFRTDADGYWMVSYDNGTVFEYVYGVDFNKVNAMGKDLPSTSITYSQTEDYVSISFPSGAVIKIDKYKPLGISFSQLKELQFDKSKRCDISFSITGADGNTRVELLPKGNIDARLAMSGSSSGSISIMATGPIDYATKLFVYLCSEDVTITNVATFRAVDDRIETVIPDSVRDRVDDYIDIYDGIHPPFIEGSYIMDPFVCVYCEDYGYGGLEPGTYVVPMEMRFFDQDRVNNTISFEEYEDAGDYSSFSAGYGAFISGEDNDFTVYFNLEGYTYGIYTKTAVLLSGHYTSKGIKNCKYAFIMLEKGYDPENLLMEEGVFRVFEDEDLLAEPIKWTRSRALMNNGPGKKGMPLKFSVIK